MHEERHDGDDHDEHAHHDHGDDGLSIKRLVVYVFITVFVGGLVPFALTGGAT